mgnify:CR=1 FL=1
MALTKVRGLGLGTLDDNITFSTAGKGVHLGVTSATSSNLLDDYEEGTYTVALTAGTGSFGINAAYDTAGYVKIGRQVFVQAYLNFSSESSASGSLRMNIPFALADEITELGDRFGSASMLIFGTAANTGTHAITGISGDGASIRITDHSGNTIVDSAATELDDNFDFYFSFNYMTNS